MNGLDPARIAMLTGGSGLVVGSVAPGGAPLAVRAWSASIAGEGGRRLRVGMSADDPEAVTNASNSLVAVTAADVPTLRSVQIKGRVVAVEAPTAADLELVGTQSESFFRAIQDTDGYPVEALRRLLPEQLVMLEIDVTEVYDQTPGPGAGAQLEVTV